MSEAVRNKMRANDELRRQGPSPHEHQSKLLHLSLTDEERRRDLALKQYQKNKELSSLFAKGNFYNDLKNDEVKHLVEHKTERNTNQQPKPDEYYQP